MKVAHNTNKNQFLINIEDWISENTGKVIGVTVTELAYIFTDYNTSGKRLSNKKSWIERKRNTDMKDIKYSYDI